MLPNMVASGLGLVPSKVVSGLGPVPSRVVSDLGLVPSKAVSVLVPSKVVSDRAGPSKAVLVRAAVSSQEVLVRVDPNREVPMWSTCH